MAAKADFYMGRGGDAEWLGSIEWDGMPEGIPELIRTAVEGEVYRREVKRFLAARPDCHMPEQGWPWKWNSSRSTNYSYAFEKDRVYACCFGSSWWKAVDPEPDHTTLTSKAAYFPYMGHMRP